MTTENWDNLVDPFAEENLMDVLEKVDQERKGKGEPDTPKEEDDKEAKGNPPVTEKYTKEELLAVYDTLVFEGSYTEVYKSRGINAVFRTRNGDDVIRLNQYLDSYQAKSMASLQTYSNMLTLAASLKSVNGKEFKSGDIQSAYAHLKTLPDALNTLLLMHLSDFDNKVGLAIDEGRKNF